MTHHKWAWLDDAQSNKICWKCFIQARRHSGGYWEYRQNSKSVFGIRVPRCAG